MKRWLSTRLSVVQAPFRSTNPLCLGAAAPWRRLHTTHQAAVTARGLAPSGKGWLCQAAPSHSVAPTMPTVWGLANPIPGSWLGQSCESVNILFIISITLLHYSLFNSLLFYY